MSENRLADDLEHKQRAAADASNFVEGLDKPDFLAVKRNQSAGVMCLVVVDEAATKLMEHHVEFAAQHPEVSRRNMRGMRNRIAHG